MSLFDRIDQAGGLTAYYEEPDERYNASFDLANDAFQKQLYMKDLADVERQKDPWSKMSFDQMLMDESSPAWKQMAPIQMTMGERPMGPEANRGALSAPAFGAPAPINDPWPASNMQLRPGAQKVMDQRVAEKAAGRSSYGSGSRPLPGAVGARDVLNHRMKIEADYNNALEQAAKLDRSKYSTPEEYEFASTQIKSDAMRQKRAAEALLNSSGADSQSPMDPQEKADYGALVKSIGQEAADKIYKAYKGA